jgi:SET domain-containing protein
MYLTFNHTPVCMKGVSIQFLPFSHPAYVTSENPSYPARGLFATKKWKTGEIIGLYGGLVRNTTKTTYRKEYYCVALCNQLHWVVDAKDYGNEARFINCRHGTNMTENVELTWTWSPRTGEVLLVVRVIAPISSGEELLLNYGDEYWKLVKGPNDGEDGSE